MRAIICIGNRYDSRDAAGPAVHDLLAAGDAIEGIELIDGGIAGLSLLRWIDGAERVVFVDSVSGFGEPGEVVSIDPADVEAPEEGAYGHGSGLAYLLRVVPLVCERGVPEIVIIGIEGEALPRAIAEAADLALAGAAAKAPPRSLDSALPEPAGSTTR